MSYVVIEGTVTTKPTLRTFERSGRTAVVGNFLVSVRDRVKEADSWLDSYPEVYDVAAFGDLGRRAHENLSPGDRVVVTGTVTKLGRDGRALPSHYDNDGDSARPESNESDDVFEAVPAYSDAWFNRRLQADHVGISLRFLTAGEYARRSRKPEQRGSRSSDTPAPANAD